MSTDRDVTRLVRSWLEEGATALPDRVLDAVLDQVPATPQRRAWWPARRFAEMNNVYKLLIAAAAMVAVAVAGIYLLPRSGGIGGPGPTASPSPTPSPVLTSDGPLEAGTTYLINDNARVVGPRWVVITVPAIGWSSTDNIVDKDLPSGSGLPHAKLSTWTVGNLKADPCKWHGGGAQPPVGPSVDDLATALAKQVGSSATVTEVTVGGYQGKKVEYSAPTDFDPTSCDEGAYSRWQPAGSTDWGGWVAAAGQHNAVYIIDIDGQRLVIDTFSFPTASAADLVELDQIIASIRFEPKPSGASPSP